MVDTVILPRLTIYNLLFAHLRNATFWQKPEKLFWRNDELQGCAR